MILVIKIKEEDYNNYTKNFTESLNSNINNSIIKKIIIFTDIKDLKVFNKKVTISKINADRSEADIIEEVKKSHSNMRIMWSNPFCNFDNSLSKLNTIDDKAVCYIDSVFNNIINKNSNDVIIFNSNVKTYYDPRTKLSSLLDLFRVPKINISDKIKVSNKRPNIFINNKSNIKKIENVNIKSSKIDVIIVSVNYNDFLLLSLTNNKKYIGNITVVTSSSDTDCQELCNKLGVKCVITDRMYENGAEFNKGKAINDGIKSIINPDWILVLDSDIILTGNIDLNKIGDDNFYTSGRYLCNDYISYKKWQNNEITIENIGKFEKNNEFGFFQLFNFNCIYVNKKSPYPESFNDASNSDLEFKSYFPNKAKIDIDIIHLGEPYKNWKGRITDKFISDEDINLILESYEEVITILYPPTINWHLLFQRPQQLMKNFSQIEGVSSIFWNPRGEKELEKKIESLSTRLHIVDQFVKVEDFQYLFEGKKILWFSHPSHHYLSNLLNWDLIIFDAIDNPVDEFSEWATELNEAVKKSDIIFASAKIMYEDHKKSGKPVYMLPNGSDFEIFEKSKNKLEKPEDFPKIDGPVIGYYGAMASWLDWKMVEKISTKYKIVMIGGNKYYNEKIDSRNIYYLSHKSIEELPYYLSNFDIPIIPFKLSEMIKGCDPIKFYEYIASGKPVVVTEMEELKRFEDICYFMNYENCIDVIEKALQENDLELRNKRIEISKQNSWQIRTKLAIKKIKNHL